MDKYDEQEPAPEPHFFDANPGTTPNNSPNKEMDPTFKPSKDVFIPIKDTAPVNPDQLYLGNSPIPIQSPNPNFQKTAKTPYSQTKGLQPVKDLGEKHTVEIPRRKQPKRSTKTPKRWGFSAAKHVKKVALTLALYTGTGLISNEVQGHSLYPRNMPWPDPKVMHTKQEIATEHFVYHSKLAQMKLMDPECEEQDAHIWSPESILSHKITKNEHGNKEVRLKIQWTDGDKAMVKLEDLRFQYPLMCMQYGLDNKLLDLPGWEWVKSFIEEDDRFSLINRMIMAAQTAPKYKFGVEVAKSPKHALELDEKEGKTQWKKAIKTELQQILDYNTFKVLEKDEKLPPGYKRIPYHIIFDVKVDGRHKARLVAGGHRTEPPKEDTYSGVVSLEAIRMGFLLAKLNGLTVCAGDVGNAFLYGKTREKVFVIAGPEFGPELEGKRMIVDKSLYGLKTSSARFHEHLSATLSKFGFKPSKAYTDLWMKKVDGHYEYIARYVDDVIIFSRDPMKMIKQLQEIYTMKGVGSPEYYLGGDVLELGEEWHHEGISNALTAETYIKNVVPKLEKMVGKTISHRWKTPFSEDYHAELDETEFCSIEEGSKYRSLIGSANWVVTLGRYDIAFATATLARYCMPPRKGHYEAAQRIMGYLRNFPKGKIFIDPESCTVREQAEPMRPEDWDEFYPDAEEEIPHDVPEPYGRICTISVLVDADHARDQVTRRSVTGIILFVNNMPLIWITKRQKTVETSTYGAELVAARMATETLLEVRYKLRMLGVPVEETSVMMGDNMSVVLNTTLPSSVLKKKHNACAYHRVRETIAAGIMEVRHIDTINNVADILTKPLGPQVFHRLLKENLFRRPITVTEGAPKHMVGMVTSWRA